MAQTGARLTPRQRQHLKALAHQLRPIIHVGKGGVDDDVARTLAEAFQNRELLKVKVLEAAPASAQDTAAELVAQLPAARLVQVIGRTIVLYRQHPEHPEIRLPT
jgi:RNA-binding protein